MQWDFGGFPWWLSTSQVRLEQPLCRAAHLCSQSAALWAGLVLPWAAAHGRRTRVQVVGGGGDKATQMRIRSDDPRYLQHVDRWWNTLLPRLAHLTYQRGARPPWLTPLAVHC